ncbi:protein yippee-like 4 [Microcaecilia unicolor]|uniref:Protein yippee-like n=1 Tax=Microcaecilia unicolor TaxID=1415580 RepID=A0A6P7WUX5_9AMPH|nr:protein yippee-like 4 [Microcaecilia unicolor]
MLSFDPGPGLVAGTATTSSLPVRTFRCYLPRYLRTYSCVHCRAHLAKHEELISKSFQGSHGRAYLFNSVVNIGCRPAEERLLLTGLHSVADIFCENCKTTLGWKYERAFEISQKYKEGKYIIEVVHMVKENGWE